MTGLAVFECLACGEKFNRFPSRNRGAGIYCSRQCFGLAHRGRNSSRYGLGQGLGHYVSEETKRKLSISNRGQTRTDETRKRMSLARMGRKPTAVTRLRMSEMQKISQNRPGVKERRSEKQKGPRHWNWKGGISGTNHLTRVSYKFREWREAVFKRDDWTCQDCGLRGGFLHPHHILAFAEFTKLRFEINNGKTLCVNCHRQLHFGGVLRQSP